MNEHLLLSKNIYQFCDRGIVSHDENYLELV